jgi:hypothetical protein
VATPIADRNAVQDTIAILLERRSIALPSRDDQIKALHGLKGAQARSRCGLSRFDDREPGRLCLDARKPHHYTSAVHFKRDFGAGAQQLAPRQ